MLRILHIENVAVIESADVEFGKGLHVLTGETGAGKSIVIDAISAILGERTSREVIRTGASRAFVSAVFDEVAELGWFAETGVDYDPAELLVQREISPDGKTNCRVNGRPVTVGILRKLGLQLINIHGQHDSQQLFDEANHLTFLDAFAHDEQERAAYAEAFSKAQALRHEIARLDMDESEKARLVETLEYQIGEIERAELTEGEDEELEARRKLLQNAEKLSDALEAAAGALYGDEDSDGAAALLAQAEKALSRVKNVSDDVAALYQKVGELVYAAQDAAEEARDVRDSLTYSAEELEQIEERLDVLHKLKRKYGASVAEILQFLAQARAQLDEIEFASDKIERLRKQLIVLDGETTKAGLSLRSVRQRAAAELEQRIQSELSQLDMPKVRFQCQFEEQKPQETGLDLVRFLMSANVGESLRPMAKVASGGELARIMLAMKNVLAEQDAIPTLIFDEVDAGVSGRAAQKVAEKLWAVAQSGKQVLCVTHLPQIAAMADRQYTVEKRVEGGRTYTRVHLLDQQGRVQELARLTGGAAITETTLAGARELLATAQTRKAGG